MKKSVITIVCVVFLLSGVVWGQTDKPTATHQPADSISLNIGGRSVTIHTFCVDKKGRLLVAAGGAQLVYRGETFEEVVTPSAIHVLDANGKELAVWAIEVTPEALAVGPDNSVYAAGKGKVVHLDETGNVLKTMESPHMEGLPPMPPIPEADEETAEQKEARKKRLDEVTKEIKEFYQEYGKLDKELQKAKKADDEDAQIKLAAEMEKMVADKYAPLQTEQNALYYSKHQVAVQAYSAALSSRSVKSIAVTEKYIFLCTPPPRGYAPEVWRLDADFANPKVIVKSLAGCCGQMNISAVDDKLVIPENARMKVHLCDAEGTRLESWGDTVTGFGSCCNPMNVAFDSAGNVLTSEASVGAIKRFKQDGTFIDLVAQSKIVPGCKHTPIGMSPDGSKAYMLDITRRNILVMEKE